MTNNPSWLAGTVMRAMFSDLYPELPKDVADAALEAMHERLGCLPLLLGEAAAAGDFIDRVRGLAEVQQAQRRAQFEDTLFRYGFDGYLRDMARLALPAIATIDGAAQSAPAEEPDGDADYADDLEGVPAYYLMPDGKTQVKDVAQHLTGNAAQAVQYVVRSSRLDGNNKSNDRAGRLQDLKKAADMIVAEVQRVAALEGEGDL